MKRHLLLSVIAMTCAMTASAQTVQDIGGSINKGNTLLPSDAFNRAPAKVTAEQLLGWPLLWSRKGCLPEYMALVCGVLIR